MYKSGEDRRIMVKVAKLYYFEGHTQAQIAKIIGVSRPIISKLLTQAREENVVEIYQRRERSHCRSGNANRASLWTPGSRCSAKVGLSAGNGP
ncbi:sigma factor-like helix-turn-helix DNA-binding protein [Salimicrobium flavidum]|uniref:Sigma-70, region 4 n=1 Tax=Salimicrobium flavidum TaxID=570947 RepID=A0A1N7K097_9BACI|nr:Sigma-70, region 4 [Salimicrobium flavidum]